MKNILITFGGRAYDPTIEKIIGTSVAAEYRVYDDVWLMQQPFYQINKWIFDRQPNHGFGFCCWKPFIIMHALANFASVGSGDVVMYMDADTAPLADFTGLFHVARRDGLMLFEEQGCSNQRFVKQDCYLAMGLADQARDQTHACGRFSLWGADSYLASQVLIEWQVYSLNPMCQFHEGSSHSQDDPNFGRNSCEQSVLSLLARKYSIPLHRTPDQNGWPVTVDKPEDTYPQLFEQRWVEGRGDLSGSRYRNV